jgi:DUF3037 family protein
MNARASASYVLLKFVPDRVRFEPINIGVVVEHRGDVITRMASSVDPRVRFADPYTDVESLRAFLEEFDARPLLEQTSGRPLLDWLHEQELPNIYVTSPQPIAEESIAVATVADRLFSRLVDRSFTRPPMSAAVPSRTAARRALMSAFQAEGVLGSKVSAGVKVQGASGVEWIVDFRFATDTINLVQAATTGLRDDLRGKEHAFEAFASLIDTREPGTTGILASDALAAENDISSQIDKIAGAHGLRFVGGRRAFLRLAREVRTQGLAVSEQPDVSLFEPTTPR